MNKGDIAVFFDNPNAERKNIANADLMYLTIFPKGRDGVNPDLFKKDVPETSWQFYWWKEGKDDFSLKELEDLYDAGYAFVKKSDGWVNQRWNWNERDQLSAGGMLCMYRSEEMWKEAREARLGRVDQSIRDRYDSHHAMAEATGLGSFEQKPGEDLKQVVRPGKKLNIFS